MGDSLALIEWMLLHPGCQEVDGAPDWFLQQQPPETTMGPHRRFHLAHRDGRRHQFDIGMWTRGAPFEHPMVGTWSTHACIELHKLYPDEVAQPEIEPYHWFGGTVPITLNDAFDAFEKGDMERFFFYFKKASEILHPASPVEEAA